MKWEVSWISCLPNYRTKRLKRERKGTAKLAVSQAGHVRKKWKLPPLDCCSNLERDSTFAREGLCQCHPLLHTLTEQVVKVDRTETVSGDAYMDTCPRPPCTHSYAHMHWCGISTCWIWPFVLPEWVWPDREVEQDEGAEGFNLNLIKRARLVISYGNICCTGTMTLFQWQMGTSIK